MATVTRQACDQSRIWDSDGPGIYPPVLSSGDVGQGFCAALTAREGNQSRTFEAHP